ncbi:MAG: hypothetical protein RR977_02325 [Oscillospiraceae bacterium]
MDDLNSTLQEILGSEEGMKQLQEMAQMLGIGTASDDSSSSDSSAGKETSEFDLNDLLKNFGGNLNSTSSDSDDALFQPADLLKFGQLFQSIKQDSANTVLLKSLRPLLKKEKRHKVDEAVKLMKLVSMWPALKESGIVSQFLGDSDQS